MSDCSTHAFDVPLKSCPFCGGEAHTYRNNLWHVGCEHAHNGCVTMSAFVTEAEAVAAWNARAERTCERVFYKPTGVLVCSECGAGMPKQLDKYCYLNYCPNCGAKVVSA